MNDPREIFGKTLRLIRHSKGWSQEKLALESNLDRTYIGGVERGERNISLLNIFKIANALELSPKALFDFDKRGNIKNK